MKGFIEVHLKKDDSKCLCNIQHIICACGNKLALFENGTVVECRESYEEIKKLIEEAL